ncbi:hypothetical protein CcaCcLH18_08318 [Colletotrichum camelliae]|nr:hypothetical protein CcaCcLH18_08318 [Colletotrichum camelliae]
MSISSSASSPIPSSSTAGSSPSLSQIASDISAGSQTDQLLLDFSHVTDDGQPLCITKHIDKCRKLPELILVECGVSAWTHAIVQLELSNPYKLRHQSCGIFFWLWSWFCLWLYYRIYHKFCNYKFPQRFTINISSYHSQHHLRHQYWRN